MNDNNRGDSGLENPEPIVSDTLKDSGHTSDEAIVETRPEPHLTPNSGMVSIFKVLALASIVSLLVVSLLLNVSLLVVDSEKPRTDGFQEMVLLGSLLIVMVSLSVNFWLYYVRTMYLKDGPALVPEKWARTIVGLTKVIEKSNVATVQTLKSVSEASNFQTRKSEGLLESFLTMQSTIDNRDEEIARLRKGYDAKVFKRFIKGFIGVSIALEEIREEEKESDQHRNYKFLCRKIQNVLEDCGVENVFPETGADYRELGDEVEDDPDSVTTNSIELDYAVESVVSPAYVLVGEGDTDVIVPARVKIYRYEREED